MLRIVLAEAKSINEEREAKAEAAKVADAAEDVCECAEVQTWESSPYNEKQKLSGTIKT